LIWRVCTTDAERTDEPRTGAAEREGTLAKDVILLGEMAARDVATIDIRCGRCDRHGRRPVKRSLARYGPDASIRDIMEHRDDTQLYTRDLYCPTLVQLFSPIPRGGVTAFLSASKEGRFNGR